MGSGPSAPAAPDYVGAARETAQGSIEAAKQAAAANRINQITPYGNLTYSQAPGVDGKDGAWTATTNLSPEQQQLLAMQNRTSLNMGALQDSATSRLGSALGGQTPASYDATRDTNKASELINQRLEPQQRRDRAALESQLANQGIMQGSEAYNAAQDQQGRQENDARQQAELQGISLGMGQQQQAYQQQVTNRNIPLNELNAIRTGTQVTNPTFNSGMPQQQTGQGANMLGAVQGKAAYDQSIYNAETATNNSNTQAGVGAAATIAAAYFM